MTELELTEQAMDIRAIMSIEISDIWLEIIAAQKNQDRQRMATAIERLECPKLQLARPRAGGHAARI
jgi:hypothetical protein